MTVNVQLSGGTHVERLKHEIDHFVHELDRDPDESAEPRNDNEVAIRDGRMGERVEERNSTVPRILAKFFRRQEAHNPELVTRVLLVRNPLDRYDRIIRQSRIHNER